MFVASRCCATWSSRGMFMRAFRAVGRTITNLIVINGINATWKIRNMRKPTIAIIREQPQSQTCQSVCPLHARFEIVVIHQLTGLPHAVAACRPQAVIIDTSAPSAWNGLDLADAIRQMSPALPILLIPDRLSEELLLRCIHIGVNEVMTPPCDCDAIAASLSHVLARCSPAMPLAPAEADSMAAMIG